MVVLEHTMGEVLKIEHRKCDVDGGDEVSHEWAFSAA